ncbi:MAG: chemotaxis protein CheW [Burkholderiaceae bacterium]
MDSSVRLAPAGAGPAPRSLPPSEALARHVRPTLVLAGATRRSDEIARYGFAVGSFAFLIGRGVGSEVLDNVTLAPVPCTPAWLAGVMNLRGHPVPVFDLALTLDVARDAMVARTPVLVLGKGNEAAGFLIDGLPRAVTGARPIALPSALPDRLAPFVSGALHQGDSVWLEFDHAGFLRALFDH